MKPGNRSDWIGIDPRLDHLFWITAIHGWIMQRVSAVVKDEALIEALDEAADQHGSKAEVIRTALRRLLLEESAGEGGGHSDTTGVQSPPFDQTEFYQLQQTVEDLEARVAALEGSDNGMAVDLDDLKEHTGADGEDDTDTTG